MMNRGLFMLHYYDIIIGKFFSDIESNDYFLIRASFYIFENIYFIAEVEVFTVLQILISPLQCRLI